MPPEKAASNREKDNEMKILLLRLDPGPIPAVGPVSTGGTDGGRQDVILDVGNLSPGIANHDAFAWGNWVW